MKSNLANVALAVGATALIATSANADFSGPYAPANWTLNTNGGDGSATNNGTTLTLTGNNDANGVPTNTDYTIAAAAAGTWSFNWQFASGDTGTWDSGGYLINGTYTALAFNNSQGSGSVSVGVLSGDTIGFRAFSEDGSFGAGTLTITNFNAPVPAPGVLALLGLAGFTGSRRRR